MIPAHRISYELHYGPIPSGMVVMHKCDNRRCVNPAHLTVGTQADNLADMRAKGRAAPFNPSMPGASHPLATITPEIAAEVLRLRSEGWTQEAIAKELHISKGTAFYIYSGKHWTSPKT
jgi:DNA-binding NarL/FixJ family response regulator